MKRTIQSCLSAVLTILMLLTLFSCNDSGKSDGTTTANGDDSGATAEDNEQLKIIENGQSAFSIVRPDSPKATVETAAAVKLNTEIANATGNQLTVVTDWDAYYPVNEYEICIGNLTRNGKSYEFDASTLGENGYTVRVIGNRILFIGANEIGTKKAVDWFIETYLKVEAGSLSELSLPKDFVYNGSYSFSQSIRIMSQNLLASDTEYNKSDYTIAKRKTRVLSLFDTYKPDSMGVQECSDPWRTIFGATLDTMGYKYIGASKNPKIGIVYNKNKLKAVSNGSFYLTEDPAYLAVSKEWNTSNETLIERLGMYVVFEVIETGERFIHFNTHVETPRQSNIQTKQVEVILQYIKRIQEFNDGIPAVITGDFNFNSTSSPYKTLTSTTLGDTKYLATDSTGAGSFNKLISQDYASLPIDQIMVTNFSWKVSKYSVIYDKVDGFFISDHYAVLADIAIIK